MRGRNEGPAAAAAAAAAAALHAAVRRHAHCVLHSCSKPPVKRCWEGDEGMLLIQPCCGQLLLMAGVQQTDNRHIPLNTLCVCVCMYSAKFVLVDLQFCCHRILRQACSWRSGAWAWGQQVHEDATAAGRWSQRARLSADAPDLVLHLAPGTRAFMWRSSLEAARAGRRFCDRYGTLVAHRALMGGRRTWGRGTRTC